MLVELDARRTAAAADGPPGLQQENKPRLFKTRELKRLVGQLRRAADDIQQLEAAGLARRALPSYGSPVLALTLPNRLRAYAEHIVPVLLGARPSQQLGLEDRDRQPAAAPLNAQAPVDELVTALASEPSSIDAAETSPTNGEKRTISPAVDQERSKKRRAVNINLHSLDSLTEALGPFEMRDLKRIQRRLVRLAARLRQLQATKAGEEIEGAFRALVGLPEQLDQFASKVLSLMRDVPVGPKRRPDTTRQLWRLVRYVHERTGTYHDRQLAQILDDSGFTLGPEESIDESALRTWRHQHPQLDGT